VEKDKKNADAADEAFHDVLPFSLLKFESRGSSFGLQPRLRRSEGRGDAPFGGANPFQENDYLGNK
jgi:hypothetical protein